MVLSFTALQRPPPLQQRAGLILQIAIVVLISSRWLPFARIARETFGSTRPRPAGMRASTSRIVAPCAPTPGASTKE